MNLRELGEDQLLRKILPQLPSNSDVIAGAGDDCAVMRSPAGGRLLLLKTDCLVEGVHFPSDARPAAVGWKAMARPLSDFAAMSGLPQFALVTLVVPPTTPVKWTTQMYRGLAKAARAFDVAIVGGEISRIDGARVISVSISGFAEENRWVTRSGGRDGDQLFVTGTLGGSIRGKHLRFVPRIAQSRWLTSHYRIHALMDLSDGLGADLPRLARASNLGFELDKTAIPRNRGCTIQQAISDGEDYELLFAIGSRDAPRLQKTWTAKFPRLRLTRIGSLVEKSQASEQNVPGGYAHFR